MTRSQPRKSNPNNTEIAEAASTAMNAARTVAAVATRPNRRCASIGYLHLRQQVSVCWPGVRRHRTLRARNWVATKLVAARTNQLFEPVTAYRCDDAQ